MYLPWWILGAVIVWFGVECGVRSRGIRVAIQAVLVVAFCGVAATLGWLLGERSFDTQLQANNLLKNLTRGLVSVTADEDYNRPLLRERLEQLDAQVIPTYETMLGSREAVEEFLSAYGMEYEEEIPISEDAVDEVTSGVVWWMSDRMELDQQELKQAAELYHEIRSAAMHRPAELVTETAAESGLVLNSRDKGTQQHLDLFSSLQLVRLPEGTFAVTEDERDRLIEFFDRVEASRTRADE